MVMTSIVPIVCDIEQEFGSVKNADMFDKRLVLIRKRFNHGVDPIVREKIDIDTDIAQRMLDLKMDKEDIAKFLGIPKYKLQKYITNGYLSDDIWKQRAVRRGPSKVKYKFYKNGDYVTTGTYTEISDLTKITVASLRYYRTKAYKMRRHTIRYRLVEL